MFLDNLRARIYNEVKAHTTALRIGRSSRQHSVRSSVLRGFSFSAQTGRLFGRINSAQGSPWPQPEAHSCSLSPNRMRTRAPSASSGHAGRVSAPFCVTFDALAGRAPPPRIWRADKPTAAPGGILSGREVGIVLRLSGTRQDASNAPYRSGTRIGVRLRRAASGRASRNRAPPCAVRTRRHDLDTAARHPASRVGLGLRRASLGSSVGANAPHAIISS